MKNFFSILSLLFVFLLGNAQEMVRDSVPFEEFLNVDEYGVKQILSGKDANDSVIPYIVYDYVDSSDPKWKGVLLAIPKISSFAMKRYTKIDTYVAREYLEYLSDLKSLIENFDMYVYYITREQLTNLDEDGKPMVDEDGDYEWVERGDAVASIFLYVEGKWKFFKEQPLEGTLNSSARLMAHSILKER